MVRLIKTAITGVCACGLIVSSTQLGVGYVTYALDGTAMVSGSSVVVCPDPAPQAQAATVHTALSENAVLALFPPEVETPSEITVYERPALVRPDGYEGDILTFDADENVYLYGNPLVPMTGKAEPAEITENGTPAKTETAEHEYFADAVMIGNSLVAGMQKTGIFDNVRFYANIGLNVSQFFDKACFLSPDGETATDGTPVRVSAAEALIRDDSFKKVYLMFGINELGWPGTGGFISYYASVIDAILNIRPDAIVYVQAIMPINEEIYRRTENAMDGYTNERIAMFNAEIEKLAKEKRVIYLTPGEAVVGEDGQLRADATTDGIHLNANFIKRWRTYLETHTVPEVDPAIFYKES